MRRVRRVAAGLVVAAGLLAAPAAQAQELPGTFSLAALDVPAPWTTFGNAQPAATFDQPAPGTFTVSAAGADLWQSTDQYGVVYQPDATARHFEAIVMVESFASGNNSAKAGIMVRNDVTLPGQSTGYMVLSQKGDGEAEFLHDAGGNGQVNNADEPVAVGCGKAKTPLWLKVRKVSNVFTAWCSRDGVAWTPVGGPILISSADNSQDIGMFVSSHVAQTHATAKFTDWSLNAIHPPAPACTPDRSDEFEGETLDTGRWTTVRGTATVGGGNLTLPITQGDVDGANTGPISYVGQAAPEDLWTATTKVTLEQDNEWQYAGLLLHVDDNNYTKVSFTKHQNDSRFLEFWSETGGTRVGHGNNITVPAATGDTVYLRMTSNGRTVTAHYSLDGETFAPVGTPAPLKTGANVGLVAAGDTDAQNKTAAFDWFHLTPDGARGFDDEFDGGALDGCRWNRIENWDGGNLAVQDGKLEITTFDADIDAGNNRAIQNLIMQAPPAGDWTIETKMTAPLIDSWQLAGFMVYGDDDHYVKYDVVADNAPGDPAFRRVELRYENGGGLTGPGGADEAPPVSPTDTWYLRLTKTGDTYTGAIRTEDGTWHKTPGSVTLALTDPAVGLMAIGPDQDAGPIDVTFDYIRLVQNAAPEITAASATPEAGTAPLPVQFSAAATDFDGDAVSYSWDFGNGGATEDATTKEAAFTYAEPGTYTAKVTVSDGKATDSETVTVTVAQNLAPVITSATATPSTGKAPLPVQFTAAATDANDGDTLSYSWDFGNGGTTQDATTKDAAFTYPTTGAYTAKVTVSDGKLTTSKTVAVTVKANSVPLILTATATPDAGTAPLPVQFKVTAIDGDDDALSYSWDFGDGGSVQDAATKEAAFTYAAAGAYTAKVTVSDGESTASQEVKVTVTAANRAPTVTASADPASGTAPLAVAFTATGQDPEGDALTYAWSFGDGGNANGATATHTFGAAGTYSVTVTVQDAKGSTGSAVLTVVAGAGPGASGNRPSVILRPVAPASIKAFAKRGVKVGLRCPSAGKGTLSARVSKQVAKRLGVSSRVLGTAKVKCVAGKTVSYRLKPSRKVRKALLGKRVKSLKLALRLALPGQDVVQRTLTVKR